MALSHPAPAPMTPMNPMPLLQLQLLLVALLALSHVLYAAVWLGPGAWKRAFGRRCVTALVAAAAVGKGVRQGQIATAAALHLQRMCCGSMRAFAAGTEATAGSRAV
jgi:hypothetical protein